MKEGEMYQVIGGQVVEVVRRGSELVPNTEEGLGQLVLKLTYGEQE